MYVYLVHLVTVNRTTRIFFILITISDTKDICNTDPNTGCYFCSVGGEKFVGNDYFRYVSLSLVSFNIVREFAFGDLRYCPDISVTVRISSRTLHNTKNVV